MTAQAQRGRATAAVADGATARGAKDEVASVWVTVQNWFESFVVFKRFVVNLEIEILLK